MSGSMKFIKRDLYSKENIKEKVNNLYDEMVELSEELLKNDAYIRYSKALKLSYNMQILEPDGDKLEDVLIANPSYTLVITDNLWRKVGRRIKESEVSNPIYVTEIGQRIYDVSQTEGKDIYQNTLQSTGILEDDSKYNELFASIEASSKYPTAIIDAMALGSNTKGYFVLGKEILLLSTLGKEDMIHTFLHELAHTKQGRSSNTLIKERLYMRYEIEAELVSSIISSILGLDFKEYSASYISIWSIYNLDVPSYLKKSNVKSKILKITKDILKILDDNLDVYSLYKLCLNHASRTEKFDFNDQIIVAIHMTKMLAEKFDLSLKNYTCWFKMADFDPDVAEMFIIENQTLVDSLIDDLYTKLV